MRVAILGPITVEVEERLVALTAARERAVLGLLALHAGQAVSVSSLIDHLWIEPPPNARKTVQNYVARLRKVLPPGSVVSTSSGYRFLCEPDAVDAARFCDLAAAGAAALANGHPGKAATVLNEALGLWRGELLSDAALDQPPEGEQTRYGEILRRVEEDLIEAHLALGEHTSVVPEAEAGVLAEPLRERRWGQLMIALYRAGRQADALRAYQRCRTVLIDELGVEPGPPLQELERMVLEQDPRLLASQPVASSAAAMPAALDVSAGAGPLIGREECRTALAAEWQAVRQGAHRTFVVQGEPGAGKTRLVADLAVRVLEDGGQVLYGRCLPELTVAYEPLYEALGPDAADLLEFTEGRSDRPSGHGQALQQYRLFQRVAGWLGNAARDRPVLLALDDLHWATASTRRLLVFLAEAPELKGVLLVATARHTEGPGLAELGDVPGSRGLTLGPLTTDDVRELVHFWAPDELADATTVHRMAGGNPLLVVQHLHDHGSPAPRTPDVVAARLARLQPPARASLDLAAVAGVEFDLSLLMAAHEESAEQILQGIEEAEVAGLVTGTGTPGGFAFVHAVVRAAILDALPSTRLMRLHRDLADALLRRTVDERNVGVLAHHCCAAAALGLAQPAVEYARTAGAMARSLYAFEEAAAFFGMALDALETWDHPDDAIKCDLLIGRGEALFRAGDAAGAGLLRTAADMARSLGDPGRLASVVFAWSETGPLRDLSGADRTLADLAEEALTELGDTEPALRARLLSVLTSELLYVPGGDARRLETGRQAERLAREAGDQRALAQTLVARVSGWASPEDLAGRVACAREAVEIASPLGDSELEATAWHLLAIALGEAGDVEGYAEARAASHRCSRDGHLASLRSELMFLDAVDVGVSGDYRSCERMLSAAMDQARHFGLPEQIVTVLQVATHTGMYWDQGRLASLLPAMEVLAGVNPRGPFGFAPLLAYLEAGDVDRARERLSQLAHNDFAEVARRTTWALTMTLAAEAATALDDTQLSSTLVCQMAFLAGRVICASPIRFDVAHRILGRLNVTVGDLEAAQRHLDVAVEQCRVLNAPPFLARTLLDRARLAQRAGNSAAAKAEAVAARELAFDLGAGGIVAGADRLLAAI